MASTYSSIKIELIGTGEQSGDWGDTTNTNLGTALEEAIVGRANADFPTDADLTITLIDSNNTQVARNYILNVTSSVALSTTRNLIVPTINKPYIVENNTTGSQSIVVKTSAGTGITVPNGKRMMLYADGTNVVDAFNNLPSGVTIGSSPVVTTSSTDTFTNKTINVDNNTVSGIAASSFVLSNGSGNIDGAAAQKAIPTGVVVGTTDTQTLTNKTLTAPTISGGTITGITDLAVADGGTGASDAAGARTNLGLGSIATQPANNVNITGGTIQGINDLAVSDGGTGASSFLSGSVITGNGTSPLGSVAAGASGNVLTSNGTTWVSQAPVANSIGVGQTWQNVSGSRTVGVTYTNSTGKPIMVSIGYRIPTDSRVILAVSGVTVADARGVSTGGFGSSSFSIIVPDGATYVLTQTTTSGTPARQYWAELR